MYYREPSAPASRIVVARTGGAMNTGVLGLAGLGDAYTQLIESNDAYFNMPADQLVQLWAAIDSGTTGNPRLDYANINTVFTQAELQAAIAARDGIDAAQPGSPHEKFLALAAAGLIPYTAAGYMQMVRSTDLQQKATQLNAHLTTAKLQAAAITGSGPNGPGSIDVDGNPREYQGPDNQWYSVPRWNSLNQALDKLMPGSPEFAKALNDWKARNTPSSAAAQRAQPSVPVSQAPAIQIVNPVTAQAALKIIAPSAVKPAPVAQNAAADRRAAELGALSKAYATFKTNNSVQASLSSALYNALKVAPLTTTMATLAQDPKFKGAILPVVVAVAAPAAPANTPFATLTPGTLVPEYQTNAAKPTVPVNAPAAIRAVPSTTAAPRMIVPLTTAGSMTGPIAAGEGTTLRGGGGNINPAIKATAPGATDRGAGTTTPAAALTPKPSGSTAGTLLKLGAAAGIGWLLFGHHG